MHVSKNGNRIARKVFSVLALLLLAGSLWAQNIKVSGIVTDEKGIPQYGVSVMVKGTKTGVFTSDKGSYEVVAPKNGTIVFSFIGMSTQEIPINNRTSINVVMKEDAVMLEELVVVGYGVQKKENLSGAVSTVDVAKTLESRPISDVGRALQGSTPGLIVSSTSGALGGSPNIKIRGYTSTLGGGSGNPLILVDNVEVPSLSYVNPDDIQSISTLKDAATTAIYGARAAFGAILITTKKGSNSGAPKVSFTSNFAWATPTDVPKHTRADLNLQYSFDQMNALSNPIKNEFGQVGYYYTPDVIAKVKEWIDLYGDGSSLGREMVQGRDFDYRPSGGTYFYRPWDIYNIYYKNWTPQQNYNVTVSGGNETTTYNLSAGMLNQKGVLKLFDDYFKRLNTAGSISTQINKWVTLRGRFMYAKTYEENPFLYAGSTYDPQYYLYRWHQVYPYGTFNGNEFRGAVNDLVSARPEESDSYYSRYTLGTTIKPIKDLSIDFDYTYAQTFSTLHRVGGYVKGIDQWSRTGTKTFDDMYTTYTTSTYDYAQYTSSKNVRNTFNAYATYDKKIGEHSFKLMAGTNVEDAEYVYLSAKRNGVYDFDKGEVNLAGGDQFATSNHSWWSIAGVFSRFNYSFKDRYLFEANVRYDGSSKFDLERRWGFFPSASAAWRVTEEPWMTPVKQYVNSLKLRASYGAVGNQDVPLGSYISQLSVTTPSTSGNYWLINGNFVPYVSSSPALVDPNLTWESVSTLDIGLDARFLRDKLGLTVDWYQRVTKDMLTTGVVIPSTIGASAPRRNYGELTTNGIEISLDFNHTFSNGLHLSATAQFTDYTSKITKFASPADPGVGSTSPGYFEGMRLGDIWGYKVDRLFQAEDFIYENNAIKLITLPNGKITNVKIEGIPDQSILESGLFRFGPGDVKFKDLDGNGVIDYGTNTLSNPGDRTVIGNTQPRYQYGFRVGADWKGFDLDVFFQGVGSRQIWATGNMVLPGYFAAEANFDHTLDYWTPTNTGAFYPRALEYAQTAKWNYVPNDRYLLDASYIRLKNLNFGYTLPISITKKVNIKKLRVYFSGENLFEIDNMGDVPIDPEIDWTTANLNDSRTFGRTYPYRRTLSFGVQIDF